MDWIENITGVQHLGIPTNDIEKTIDFYMSLGFCIVLRTVNEAAGEQVCFLQLKNLVIETYQNGNAINKTGAIDHFSLDVCDIEAAFAQAKRCDYMMLDSEIQFLPFWKHGVRFFTILGPNGEKVEFCQML